MQEFKLVIKIDDDKILCDILGNVENVEYAYYLKRNGVRIDTVWYSKEHSHIFNITLKGEYQIVGFVKGCEETIEILESEIVWCKGKKQILDDFDLSNYTISIFGSCVSRDLLEFYKGKNFELLEYFARCSVVSAVSTPIDVSEEDIKLSSIFQRRQVTSDLDKRLWDELRIKKSEYFLVDFIDERFSIGKSGNSYFTLSNEMVQSGAISEYVEVKKEKMDGVFLVEERPLEEFLEEFWNRVLMLYPSNRIILHKAKLVDSYLEGDGRPKKFPQNHLKNNQKINEMLDYMYSYSENKLQECIVISKEENCFADAEHKWGLAPMHYEDDYYISILNDIYNKITTGNS